MQINIFSEAMESIENSTHIEECPVYQRNSPSVAHSKEIKVDGKKFVFCTQCIGYHVVDGKEDSRV